MGKSSEAFINMREKEYTVNTTFKVIGGELHDIEEALRREVSVIDFKIITDTNDLYQRDEHFRKLIKIEKNARVAKEKYINDKN
ncbi:MAG: hypothetical protein ACJA2M_000272 [Polaribacter sp.]|jgi:hypothetical protein